MANKKLKYRWTHLLNEKQRGSILYSQVEKYLGNVETILDMNCGFAPLYPFLADKVYYGFDINEDVVHLLKQKFIVGRWYVSDDKDWDMDIQVDLLLLLGMGAGKYKGESETELDSLERLALKYKPKIIIVEIADKHKKDNWWRVPERLKEYVLEHFCFYDSKMEHCNERLLKLYIHEDSYRR